jgi:triosephosphate isomerase
MKVNVTVTATRRYVLDIGGLKPGLIKELIEQDEADGYFIGGTDWSVAEQGAEGETTLDSVEVTPVGGKK